MRANNTTKTSRNRAPGTRPTGVFRQVVRLATLLLLSHSTLQAQNPVTFESIGPSREVQEGTIFEVSFALKNTAAKRFIPPDFKGLFRVAGGPTEMRGAGFVNGQSYSHQTWSYELEAGSPGTYTIGPAMVQTASQTLRTQPMTIRVVKARPGRGKVPAGANDQLFVAGELDRETAWVGQQVRYQIKLYTQANISDFDILELPPFDGFFNQERQRFDTRTQYQTIRGKKYAVRVLYEMALFPQQAGDVTIGAARVRLGVEQARGLGALLGSMPVMVQTQPVKFVIKPLPEPVPEGFSGGVGHYEWTVEADRENLTTDDALTLTVKLQGNGDTRSFANPHFTLPEGLEGFDPKAREAEEYETGDQFVHSRTLEYVILPKHPGDYTFMPELIVFDPDSNRYRTLRAAKPVELHVTPGQNYGKTTAPVDTIAPPPLARSPLSDFWRVASAWVDARWLWGLLVATGLLGSLYFFWRRRKHRSATGRVETKRARPSLKTLRDRFQQVYWQMQNSDSRVFYNELLKAVQAYVAARLELEPVMLTKELMQEKLGALQVPEQTAQGLLQVWQKCEQAVFAGQAYAGNMNATWQQAETALQQLDAALK